MATGRTVPRWTRVYVDGYDLSGYASSIGPLEMEWDAEAMAAFSDEVMNAMPDHATVTIGELNGFFDNTATSGLHAIASASSGVSRVVTAAIGIRAEPAAGDPCFNGTFEQLSYTGVPESGFVTANLKFGTRYAGANENAYQKAWGHILHPRGAETAVNASSGIDNGAATAAGGYMIYHALTSNGTFTLKTQDSADNSSFLDLSGATSGSITAASAPVAGIVALGTTATVRRYLRWQIVLGTATTCTFVLAFVRG